MPIEPLLLISLKKEEEENKIMRSTTGNRTLAGLCKDMDIGGSIQNSLASITRCQTTSSCFKAP